WTTALMLLVLAVVVAGFSVAEPMRVASASMSPTYELGDEVLVGKLAQLAGTPQRGDVVVFHEPHTGTLTLNRVAAVGGDELGIEDGLLIVNGEPVNEPYLDLGSVDGAYFGPVHVPAGHVFVLGDARAGSVDSRTFGVVAEDDVVGRVLLRLWPHRSTTQSAARTERPPTRFSPGVARG
ncbi:MAG: signal peptidase I, partial [Dermatophilaceae bacterium]|nr:signal peptidase I [Dermatophilaceae bacterium]